MDEFELIERFFSPPHTDPSVLVPVGDDGAVLSPDANRDLVSVVDTLVEGVHFPTDLGAAEVAHRLLGANLSDIAAMGARPRWMTLSLSIPRADDLWLRAFSAGLYESASPFGVTLVGGDTTRSEQTVVSLQIIGDVERGECLRRGGASIGDEIYVSGYLGEAAAGLKLLLDGTAKSAGERRLVERFCRPTPRVALGQSLAGLASAAIDISDGLCGDLAKLATASGCGAELHADKLPISEDLLMVASREEARLLALAGGEDFELCFSVPPRRAGVLETMAHGHGVSLTRVGTVVSGAGVAVLDNGEPLAVDAGGFRHFEEP